MPVQAPFGRRRLRVVAADDLGPYRRLELDDSGAPPPDSGQFHMLAAAERWGAGTDERPFLPRALSVLGTAEGRLSFLLERVGPGTERLAELEAGDEVWVTGPLGQGAFAPPADGRTPILVAGGIGLPVMAYLQRTLRAAGHHPVALAGFRDARHAQAAALLDEARVATDDGSAGHHGFVTELLEAALAEAGEEGAAIYACGPPAMLEAVRGLAVARGVPAQLALESPMACGFGACFGCVVPLAGGGYARTCLDGPVIEAEALAEVPA